MERKRRHSSSERDQSLLSQQKLSKSTKSAISYHSKERTSSSDDDSDSSYSSSQSSDEKQQERKSKKSSKKHTKQDEEVERKRVKKEKKKKKKKKRSKHKSKRLVKDVVGPLPADTDVSAKDSVQTTLSSTDSAAGRRTIAPMTKAEWEKQQSVVRRVYDPTTGRNRLIKGDGEVLEEIVSKERHKQINKQSTVADGLYYQSRLLK